MWQEAIIRLIYPKAPKGKILVMPYYTVSQKGVLKPRKGNSPDSGAAGESTPSVAPLPGQLELDDALNDVQVPFCNMKSDTANVEMQGILTSDH